MAPSGCSVHRRPLGQGLDEGHRSPKSKATLSRAFHKPRIAVCQLSALHAGGGMARPWCHGPRFRKRRNQGAFASTPKIAFIPPEIDTGRGRISRGTPFLRRNLPHCTPARPRCASSSPLFPCKFSPWERNKTGMDRSLASKCPRPPGWLGKEDGAGRPIAERPRPRTKRYGLF